MVPLGYQSWPSEKKRTFMKISYRSKLNYILINYQ